LEASILAQKSEFAQLNFPQTQAPKPDCCKTYSSWILISTIQNHPWAVSWLNSAYVGPNRLVIGTCFAWELNGGLKI
jgi:hypothetical protein